MLRCIMRTKELSIIIALQSAFEQVATTLNNWIVIIAEWLAVDLLRCLDTNESNFVWGLFIDRQEFYLT